MNFLAHLYLSFDNDQIAIGNFIADAVKGRQYLNFEDQIQRGILIHREIDRYTDQHEIVKAGKRRLKTYRHYSSVIMDIFYDHFLARDWSHYSNEPLEQFTKRHYDLMYRHIEILPNKAKHILSYMAPSDWLLNYKNLDGIEFALSGMSKRTAFDSKMDLAINDLKKDYELYHKEFRVFFLEVIEHIHSFADQLTIK